MLLILFKMLRWRSLFGVLLLIIPNLFEIFFKFFKISQKTLKKIYVAALWQEKCVEPRRVERARRRRKAKRRVFPPALPVGTNIVRPL